MLKKLIFVIAICSFALIYIASHAQQPPFVSNHLGFHRPYAKKITATYTYFGSTKTDVIDNSEIIIHNNTDRDKNDWRLGFTFANPLQQIEGAKVVKQIGDYLLLAGTPETSTIKAHDSITIRFTAQNPVKHYTDTPAGYFFLAENYRARAIRNQDLLPEWKPTPEQNEYNRNIVKRKTSIEGNSVEDNLPHISIIPYPAEVTVTSKTPFQLNRKTQILTEIDNQDAIDGAKFLIKSIRPATGFWLKLRNSDSKEAVANTILLTSNNAPEDLGDEGYTLNITTDSVVIRAKTAAGFFYGVESLRQLFPPQIFRRIYQRNIAWQLPTLNIKDYPRFKYRGLLLDVSRHFFSARKVKRLIDQMALHKLNTFHWHLADDEGWRPQIKAYPSLTKIGAYRGYGRALPPAHGSGMYKYGGYYTQRQLKNIVRFAAKRHITIIPEIDMPGHARAMIQSLPHLLKDPKDHSEYKSIQGFHDNVLSPCIESTFTTINTVVDELADIFPSKYFHIGSDETPEGVWSYKNSPNCKALIDRENLKGSDDKETMHKVQHYFATRVRDILNNHSKKMAGWQEITLAGDDFANKENIRAYAWHDLDPDVNKDVNAVNALAKSGYSVIAMSAEHLYFDLAYNADPYEIGQYWAGYVDTFAAYNYSPVASNMPSKLRPHVKGVEGALWSEKLTSRDRLDYMAFPKVAALSEVAWTPKAKRNWNNFAYRVGHYYLPILDNLRVKYRIPLPGVRYFNNLIQANIVFPNLLIKYTLDGNDPTLNSPTYEGEFSNSKNTVKMRSVTSDGRRLSRVRKLEAGRTGF